MTTAATRHPTLHSGLVLVSALIALLFAGATLTGCGQKGQLYLPSQKKSKVPPTRQPQDTPPPGTLPQSSASPAAS